MNHIDTLQKGNLVSYSGRLGTKSYVEISDIKEHPEERVMFWFRPRFEFEKEFVGYFNEVREVFLTEGILKQLGFTQNGEKRDYSLNGINLKSVGSVSGKDLWNLHYTDYGWYVIPIGGEVKSEEDLKSYTPIRTLHALQNYLKDAGVELDYTVLRW